MWCIINCSFFFLTEFTFPLRDEDKSKDPTKNDSAFYFCYSDVMYSLCVLANYSSTPYKNTLHKSHSRGELHDWTPASDSVAPCGRRLN